MAKAVLGSVVGDVRGQIGNDVHRHTRNGHVIQAAPSKRTTPPSPAERAQQSRFRQGAKYGSAALKDPARRAVYEERYHKSDGESSGNTLFGLTVQDYLNPPRVIALDLEGYHGRPGDAIRVTAEDDMRVERVEVTIRDGAGTLLEAGEAQPGPGGVWTYTITAGAPWAVCPTVTAEAFDMPGHTGALRVAFDVDGRAGEALVPDTEPAGAPMTEVLPAADAEVTPVPAARAAAADARDRMPRPVEAPVKWIAPLAPVGPTWICVPAWPMAAVTTTAWPGMSLEALWSPPDCAGLTAEPVMTHPGVATREDLLL